ncbi:M23 family metallopeptidase [Funiculus sociatus GB2-A5]|uniref:M23 family metallopeptidase n=1 Tax=Funiculus sociatus GB2-A5 TaxID=2933946 RepID=A0ABV0JNJ5_9CYAN|nr:MULTISPECIES: M23 family metallopeptidase [unclassified Trichocoleus]MBD1908557.1 M23 family metallopeptidase [Trichocoleus sp. FACHB-832]MBD2063889.1 M23 family metallopeptidase [Trichocoleus sp. FACHB-6]
MKFHFAKLMGSFLMLLLGSQAAVGLKVLSEEMSESVAFNPTLVTLDFGVEATEPTAKTDTTSDDAENLNAIASKTASKLFATKKSPGSIAIGAAEGNFTLTGETTSLYFGHTDPGNHVVNRGFCSWNRAKNLTLQEANQRCLKALQRQGASTERRLKALSIDASAHTEALVNGTDLWNQSNSAGPKFASAYQKALNKGLKGRRAYTYARVEAFRRKNGVLDASGLFGICTREPYYRSRLIGYPPYSESWRWNCIALDQERRVKIVSKALRQNIQKATIRSPQPPSKGEAVKGKSEERQKSGVAASSSDNISRQKISSVNLPSLQQPSDPNSVALSFEPAVEAVPIASTMVSSEDAIATDENQIDLNVTEQNAANNSPVLLFDPFVEQVPISPAQQSNAQKVTDGTAFSSIDQWTPNLKKTPKRGDYLAGYGVTSSYGRRVHPVTGKVHFHGGVDLGTPMNTPVYAIGRPGTKTGLWCWIDANGGGLVATMTSPSFPSLKFDALHLSWCKSITNGPKIKVDAGSIIGGTGNSGRSTGPHLHFQVRDLKTGRKISPNKGQLSWVLTGKSPKPSNK